jgi:hypothetical protein
LALANKKIETHNQAPATEIATFVAQKVSLAKSNNELRAKNAVLIEEAEELKAMIELLKSQVNQKKGLIADPSTSPTLG